MSAELVFMMGDFEARFPTDRRYAKNHMWAAPLRDGIWRLGLTAYAVRLLQDVYFLDLVLEAEMRIGERQEIGSIESKKAESSLDAESAASRLLSPEDYLEHLTAAWEVAQRTIKGQANA